MNWRQSWIASVETIGISGASPQLPAHPAFGAGLVIVATLVQADLAFAPVAAVAAYYFDTC